ncbi:MAG: hypothetical protein NT080_00300 [Spirochaetes bacterium]|nr:hypothetical protein [Spirochaetota bacterium]
MRGHRWAILGALCWFFSSALLSAQAAPSSPIASPQVAPASSLPLPSDPSGTLSGASSALGQIADELETLLARLDESLARAGIYQDASERSLASSISSATSSIDSLLASEAVLLVQTRRQGLELWIWRGATAAAVAITVYALVQ